MGNKQRQKINTCTGHDTRFEQGDPYCPEMVVVWLARLAMIAFMVFGITTCAHALVANQYHINRKLYLAADVAYNAPSENPKCDCSCAAFLAATLLELDGVRTELGFCRIGNVGHVFVKSEGVFIDVNNPTPTTNLDDIGCTHNPVYSNFSKAIEQYTK